MVSVPAAFADPPTTTGNSVVIGPVTNTATGGTGGAGGAGGDGGLGIGIGGSVKDSGNSTNLIGNGLGNFSPSAKATIEKGAVQIDNKNTNLNTNFNSNSNRQSQEQDQGQSQFGYVAPVQEVTVNVPRELLGIPTLPTNVYPLITGGVVDWTANMPEFEFLKGLAKGEKVKRVLESYNGWFLNRICVEDLTEFVLEKYEKIVMANGKYKVDPSKIRYRILQKAKGKGAGIGTSANGSASALNGGSSIYGGGVNAGATIGYNSATSDPTNTVEYYEIK
jgi:hypothetical protein